MNAPSPRGAVEVISLGCRLNLSESEHLRALLADTNAPLTVVNSCAVTQAAVRETRRAIRRARRDRPEARIVVTGCAAEVERAALAAMPEVDALVANTAKLDPAAWHRPAAPAIPRPAAHTRAPARLTAHTRAPARFTAHTRAFVTVQNGCDHACTFCVIPQGRGPSRSRPIAAVVAEIAALADAGIAEVVLTGVDLTSWSDGGQSLGHLVRAILAAVPGLPRLRLSSLDGIEIDDALFDLLTHEPRVMPHVHLSLQHGADLILKRMRRRHLRQDAVRLVERLHAARPDIAIGADLIAGFPTETPAHHAENLSIIRALPVVHGHVFPYSPRPGTPAARMPQLPPPVIAERAATLRAAVAETRATWLHSLIGTPLSVLAERDGTGHAANFARAKLPAGTPAGTLIDLTPTHITEGLLAS